MAHHAHQECSSAAYREALHRRMLVYGLTVCIIGIPLGILLRLPVVWGLAIAGIAIGGLKLWARRNRDRRTSS